MWPLPNNNNNNTNTGGTNEFISFYFQYLATRGQRNKSQKPMLTILYCPYHAQVILWCLRSPLISAGRDPNWSSLIRSEKTQPRPSAGKHQLPIFSKSSNSPDHLFRVRRQPSTQFTPAAVQPHFLSGGLLWYLATPPLGQDMTQGQFLSGV